MAGLEQLHEILKVERQNARSLLCSHTSLYYLSLRGNALYPNHLETLIALLEDPRTLRIDGLNLGDIMPHDAIIRVAFGDLFQRTLTTALRVKPSTAHDKGLYLSFERSKHLDFSLVQSMKRALLDATRPVRGLSLKCVTPLDTRALSRQMRFLYPDFELDLASFDHKEEPSNEVEASIFLSLIELVNVSIPSLDAAGLNDVHIRLHATEIYEDESLAVPMGDVQASTTEYYEVVFVAPNGHFQLHVSDRQAQDYYFTGWVGSHAIAGIRIGNRDVVGSNCTRLILDNGGDIHTYVTLGPVMTMTMGAMLIHLSLRYHYGDSNQLPSYLMRCPHFIELNGTKGDIWYWDIDNFDHAEALINMGASLHVLHVTCLDRWSFSELPAFPALRYLQLTYNRFKVHGLKQILQQLQVNQDLQYVKPQELESTTDKQEYAFVKAQIQQYLDDQSISVAARMAFLSVVHHLESIGGLCLPHDTIVTIFRMVGIRSHCTVLW